METDNSPRNKIDEAGGESVHHAELGADSKELHGRAIQQQEHNCGYLETLRQDPWLLFWIGVMLWTLIVRGFENQSSAPSSAFQTSKRDSVAFKTASTLSKRNGNQA
jgi:hypothetical protein